jgi:nucleoside-diphosphate-sugar epimerase
MTVSLAPKSRSSRLAICGASGFIGCHLLASLLRKGFEVRALVRSKKKAEWLGRVGADVIVGDIRDLRTVNSAIAGCDTVFQLAAHRSGTDSRLTAYRETNIAGMRNVLSAAVDAGVSRLVFTSSVSVYGRLSAAPATEETPASPTTYHGLTKLEAERLVLKQGTERGVSVVVARLPWVLGPGSPHFAKTFRQVIDEGPFAFYGPCDPWRNVAHVDDIVDGLERCAAVCIHEPPLYLLPGHNAKLSEILRLIADEAGVQFRTKRRPLWPVERISQACQLFLAPFGREPKVMHGIEFFVRNQRFDGSKAKRELGYVPKISLQETIRSMIIWYRDSNYASSNESLLARMAGPS